MTPIGSQIMRPGLSRRKFVQGLAAGGALLGLAPAIRPAWALAAAGEANTLSGTEFDLVVGPQPVNFTGAPRIATAINGSVPGPTLRWKEGSAVTIRVTNRLAETTSIHWHGILLPYQMDGVPHISYPGIPPGATFTYRFKVQQTGTYWYHSHSGFQEQTGMYGAIIIDPATSERNATEQDYVVQLSDWTDDDPMTVLANLKGQSDYYNQNRPTVADLLADVSTMGVAQAREKREMWNQMRMSPTDFSDISASTFTYLMNGTTPAGNWTGLFRPGERIRLRFINSGAASFFDVRIPGLKLTVVAADGQPVDPVTVDEFRIAPSETYDVIVAPGQDEAYTIFAQSLDRSGYARGTLAPRPGMAAAVPAVDPPVWLEMQDMMGDMGGMGGMAGMSGMAGASGHDMHSMHNMPAGQMNHGAAVPPPVSVRHASTEYGPGVDARVDTPRVNLDDPGAGLRNNGRRALSYADLHTAGGAIDKRDPEREIELHLTGNMERYIWSVDGLEYGRSTPIRFRLGERLRIVMVNDTMMAHPFHLHGMWSDLENAAGQFQVRKHAISVQPAQRITYAVTADAPGRWAFHCHLLYHMATGMFRQVVVV
ncbi:MAG: copper resistance system multicopper oxidase [Gammaproteobacteria bacterium]|nr:copper resistance system multicopper oxidase [Rhodocyclaceae bacterium]MBU3909681.1 copper resistance system multicopper oxidase [Gammaproteobacteria bacterium]MBU3988031.1 copper resistance system multicopper oxidase [Gammaproteobacteria bacterium]MBU4005214.1 copper resistance system multicopper oxidase [Gammaproteobacteria bacterium]MBU4022393.1 copper resistance system multicopper oxidase [Gammaproteobacteria bacterium]